MLSVNDIIFSHRSFFDKIILRAHVFYSMYENRTRQSPDLSAYRLIKRKKRQTMCFHSLFVHTFIMFITLLIHPKKTYNCFFGLGIEKVFNNVRSNTFKDKPIGSNLYVF